MGSNLIFDPCLSLQCLDGRINPKTCSLDLLCNSRNCLPRCLGLSGLFKHLVNVNRDTILYNNPQKIVHDSQFLFHNVRQTHCYHPLGIRMSSWTPLSKPIQPVEIICRQQMSANLEQYFLFQFAIVHCHPVVPLAVIELTRGVCNKFPNSYQSVDKASNSSRDNTWGEVAQNRTKYSCASNLCGILTFARYMFIWTLYCLL
jgi:hypothetical protein